ncbi:MAG: Xaa-Pro dipeptidase [Patescibacteria group bacterium]
MDTTGLFRAHVVHCLKEVRAALHATGFDTLVIHAGIPDFFHADDQAVPFHSVPHFARFVPVNSPHHFLIITTDSARVIEVIPTHYWEEHGTEPDFWKKEYDVTTIASDIDGSDPRNSVAAGAEGWSAFSHGTKTAFIGDRMATELAQKAGLSPASLNPEPLIKLFDKSRSVKTEYEIMCIDEANRIASLGHSAVSDAFFAGKSEREMHYVYLTATRELEVDLPYTSIIALDDKASILHYMRKRDTGAGTSLLIDAGVQYNRYASDISRTYALPSAHPTFHALIKDLDALQQKLVTHVMPGVHFIELHHTSLIGVADILHAHGVISLSGEEAATNGVARTFYPHGFGHMLGIQVHCVSHVTEESEHPLKEKYPHVRTKIVLKENMVTTIEPGIYFIDMLLEKAQSGEHRDVYNWKLIDELRPLGGIRIEDNVVVRSTGPENLTRKYLP